MGNTQPTNKTGRQATEKKLENAKKLGVLSLTGHSLEAIPDQVFHPDLVKKLRTLDLSDNNLSHLSPKLATLCELKSFKVDNNKLAAGSLSVVSKLSKLQKFSVSGNELGHLPSQHKTIPHSPKSPPPTAILPELPAGLRELGLASNFLSSIPTTILSSKLKRLEKLDLSNNDLASVDGIWVLENLEELQLDSNSISSLPQAMGTMKKLKVLSLRDNQFSVTSTVFSEANPQPLPKSLFEDTPLIDLNLHGNKMTNTQLNKFEGFQAFLDRRQKVKSKTMQNLSVCGLK